jgi:hypothetical protein
VDYTRAAVVHDAADEQPAALARVLALRVLLDLFAE